MSFLLLGSDSSGAAALSAGYAMCRRFYCSTSGRATHLYVYNQYTQSYKWGIYEDNSGSPGTAVSVDNSYTQLTGTATLTWRSLALNEQFSLTGGNYYWLCILSSSSIWRISGFSSGTYIKNLYPASSNNLPTGTWDGTGWDADDRTPAAYLLGEEALTINDDFTNKTIYHSFPSQTFLYVTEFDDFANTSFEHSFNNLTTNFGYSDSLSNKLFVHTFPNLSASFNIQDTFADTVFEHVFGTLDTEINQDVLDNLTNKTFNFTPGALEFIATYNSTFTNKSFTLYSNVLSGEITELDFSLTNGPLGYTFGNLNAYINNSTAAFKFISDSYLGRTSADAEALEDFDLGSFMWGQTKEVKFRIGNDSSGIVNFHLLAESANNDIMNNVSFSLDGKQWETSISVQVKPNGVSDTVRCRLEMPTTAFLDDGTFLINVLRQV